MSKPLNTTAIVISCLAVSFIALASTCGLGAWWLIGSLPQYPRTRPGFGIVDALGTKGAWTTYHLRDCDLTIDLKSKPIMGPYPFTGWTRSHAATYSRYYCDRGVSVIIEDLECKSDSDKNLSSFVAVFQQGAQTDPLVVNYFTDESRITVSGHTGTLVKANYLYRGRPMLSNFLFLEAGKRLLAVRMTGYAAPNGGTPNSDHVLKSIHWTP